MATKDLFTYLMAEIDQQKIESVEDVYKLNMDYLLKKALIRYLEDKKKIQEESDGKGHVRRKIKW